MFAIVALQIVAMVCFVLAMFDLGPGWGVMVPLGLALWCAATIVPK